MVSGSPDKVHDVPSARPFQMSLRFLVMPTAFDSSRTFGMSVGGSDCPSSG